MTLVDLTLFRETVGRLVVVLVVVREVLTVDLATVFLVVGAVVFGFEVVFFVELEEVLFDDGFGERKIPLLLPKS